MLELRYPITADMNKMSNIELTLQGPIITIRLAQ